MRNQRKGFSLIELLVVMAIILIIAAIAIPNMLRSVMMANETSAVGSIRTVISASTLYASTYGTYPQSLTYLGSGSQSGNQLATIQSADLIDARLASGVKSGYTFSWTPGPTDTAGHVVSFSVTAMPTFLGTTGQRTFYGDSSGIIRAESQGIATSSSSPID